MKRGVYVVWGLTLAALSVEILISLRDLPTKFFESFGMDPPPEPQQAALMFFSVWAFLIIPMNLYPPCIGLMLKGKPDHKFAAPNRDLWLATPGGREQIVDALRTAIAGMVGIANVGLILLYRMAWNFARGEELGVSWPWLALVGAVAISFGVAYPFIRLSAANLPANDQARVEAGARAGDLD